MKLSTITSILITLLTSVTSFTLIQLQILEFQNDSGVKNPEILGATTGIGAIVPSTAENKAWAEIGERQAQLDSKEKELNEKENSLMFFLTPTPKNLYFLYILILILSIMVAVNLYLDLKIWKRQKKLAS